MLTKTIKDAVRKGNVIIGYKKSIKFLKLNKPKMIVIASNIPENIKKEIEHHCELANVKLKVFKGSSRDLGIVCGKPYPISTLIIKR